MTLTKLPPVRKDMAVRLRPNYDEGLSIQYRLKRKRYSFVRIQERLGVSNQIIANVISGRRRSARIEAEIARILGKADWNEVVLEARSEVQGKPVDAVREEARREMYQTWERRAMKRAIARDRDMAAKLRQLAKEKAEGLHG